MGIAYLVLGPEASGIRLMASILIGAGCYGDSGHTQRLLGLEHLKKKHIYDGNVKHYES